MGGVGSVREFLAKDVDFVSVDPYINASNDISPERKSAYSCLSRPLNFIAATAEFLPFLSGSFDWVHLRSVLDHVQLPDLVLLEASRVVKSNGRILIGLSVDGGKSGHVPIKRKVFSEITSKMKWVGIKRWKNHKDFHLWHPTFKDLTSLVNDNGLDIEEVYWQPHWNDTVCYICAKKR